MKIMNNFKLIKQLKYLHFVMFLLLVGNTSLLFAEVRLPNIFSDNMVLQQGIPVQIWGWANAGETVNVTFLNQPGGLGTVSTVIGMNGGNIVNLKITNRSLDFWDILVDVYVKDIKHLNNVIAALRATPEITSVDRAKGR